eukprot:m.131087 g.131087  ORF g.131087 m.131087 type:complete len:638 (-) comp15899_c0_seq1:702-2615(-)
MWKRLTSCCRGDDPPDAQPPAGAIVRNFQSPLQQPSPESSSPHPNNGGEQLVATLERFQGFEPPPTLPSGNTSRFNILRILKRDQGEAAIQRDLREMLHDLPRAVTQDDDIPSLDRLVTRAEANDKAPLKIMIEMIKMLPLRNPIGVGLATVLLELLPNPSMSDVSRWADGLLTCFQQPEWVTNSLLCLGMLASKVPGRGSELLLRPQVINILLESLERENDPQQQLFAVIACAQFAATKATQLQLVEAGVPQVFLKLEERYSRTTATPQATRQASYSQRLQVALLRAQVGFSAMWALDNALPLPDRKFAAVRADNSSVNVMLDRKDATTHLKLAPDGLEMRNDHFDFESVKATCCAQGSGLWYMEVTLFTAGIMQIGWATEDCSYQAAQGFGIGDDKESFGYDGCRGLVWKDGPYPPQKPLPQWKCGDVLGCYLDLDRHLACFAINGKMLPWIRIPTIVGKGLYPAASLMAFQHAMFNFGNEPYRYLDPFLQVQSLNGIGELTEAQRVAVPRLMTLQLLQRERDEMEIDDDAPVCSICYSSPPEVTHKPCGHAEFCMICSLHCEVCPLCRVTIEERVPLPVDTASAQAAQSQLGHESEASTAIPIQAAEASAASAADEIATTSEALTLYGPTVTMI